MATSVSHTERHEMIEVAFTPTQFGGYVEFHHEPTPAGVAAAIEKIHAAIVEDVAMLGVVKMGDARVVYKNADDYERSRMEMTDDLFKFTDSMPREKTWTVGLKITVLHPLASVAFLQERKTCLRECVVPKPLMIVE